MRLLWVPLQAVQFVQRATINPESRSRTTTISVAKGIFRHRGRRPVQHVLTTTRSLVRRLA
jgi:hypothetical protein